METVSKQQEARATDRAVEALSTLASLLDRAIHEVKGLDSDFQKRLLQAVHETEVSLEGQAAQHLEEALTEMRTKLDEHLKSKLAEMAAGWDTERNRLNSELDRLTKNSAQWELERSRLNAELERLARVQAATQIEAQEAIAAMRSVSASRTVGAVSSEAVTKEIDRVEGLIKQIADLIENPATELSAIILKNVERAELESYLKGIRFALNGGGSK
jgi:hypothetical protein